MLLSGRRGICIALVLLDLVQIAVQTHREAQAETGRLLITGNYPRLRGPKEASARRYPIIFTDKTRQSTQRVST